MPHDQVDTKQTCASGIHQQQDSSLILLDFWTEFALEQIWKDMVYESIRLNDSSGETNDWELVEHTPFTEPFWGRVENR